MIKLIREIRLMILVVHNWFAERLLKKLIKEKKPVWDSSQKIIRVVINQSRRCPTPEFLDKLQEMVQSQVSKSEDIIRLEVSHRDEPTNVNHVGFDLHPWVKLKLLQMALDWTGELDLINLNAKMQQEGKEALN